MNMLRAKWWLMIPAALVVSCGGPIQEAELHGYVDGKMQAKYITRVFKAKLDDGSPGYRIETVFTFAVGNARRVENANVSLVREDMTLVESESKFDNNGEKNGMVTKVGKTEINQIQRSDKQIKDAEKNMGINERVFHLHPLLYIRDLTEPGQEKVYRTLNEGRFVLQDIKVIYKGEETLNQDGRTFQSRHYMVENSSEPGAYQDYYVDASGKPLKIIYSVIEFRFHK